MLLPVLLALMFAFAPDQINARMVSVFDMQDPTVRDRMAMVRTGVAIIRAEPLTGIGPDMVPHKYAEYRDASAVQATNPHLHNVPLQIAAERGLPAVAVWAWFVGVLSVGLWRLFRAGPSRALAAGGLAVVASDTAGQQEVARQAPGAVQFYPSGNARALADVLNALLASPSACEPPRPRL